MNQQDYAEIARIIRESAIFSSEKKIFAKSLADYFERANSVRCDGCGGTGRCLDDTNEPPFQPDGKMVCIRCEGLGKISKFNREPFLKGCGV